MKSNDRTGAVRRAKWLLTVACLLGIGALAGCNFEMRNDSRLKPYEGDEFFKDGRSARPIPAGTVARDHLKVDSTVNAGMENGQPVAAVPYPVTAEFLERGKERFNIYCAVCHGVDGYGKGPVVQRGFPPPPSYHQDRLRRAPVGHFCDVATNGYGVMFGYWDRIDNHDRWAIAAYVKALQLSQMVSARDLTPEQVESVQQNKVEGPAGEAVPETERREGTMGSEGTHP